MSRFKEILYVFGLLTTFAYTGNAQQTPVIVFNSNEGVHLRWSMDPNAEGYKIFKKSKDTDWTLISSDPVRVISSNREIRDLLGFKSDILLGLFGLTERTAELTLQAIQNTASNEDQFKLVQAMTLVNPEFADVLGLRYLDPGGQIGTVQYKIRSITGSEESDWAITREIAGDKIDELPQVAEITAEGGDRTAQLAWPKDEEAIKKGEIVTYHVYRSDSELGPYIRVNYFGILPGKIRTGDTDNDNLPDADLQYHADRELENGKSYFYHVKAVNAFDIEGPASLTVEVIPGNYDPPAPPNNISAVQTGNAAQITWSHDDELLKGFEISRSTRADGEYQIIYPKTSGYYSSIRSYLDFDLSPGLIYYYRIRSVNTNDVKGTWSNPVEYINWDKVPPAAPTGLSATTDDKGRITIRWKPSPEEDVIGYHIDRATDNNYSWQFRLNMKMLSDNEYVDQRPETSQSTYGYVVYAIDRSLNMSPASEMIKARLPDVVPPQAPIFTALDQIGDSVTLQWTKSIEEDLDHYNLYRANSETMQFYWAGSSYTNQLTDVLPAYGDYQYYVTANDKDANESEHSAVISTTFQPSEYPDSPESASIALLDGKVHIQWQNPADDRITGYLVSRYTGASTDRKDIAQINLIEELKFIDKYVVSGRTYTYEIRAHDKDWQLSIPATLTIAIE